MRVMVCGKPPSDAYRDGVLDALHVSQTVDVLIDLFGVAGKWPERRRVKKLRTIHGRPELVVSFGLTDQTIEARESGVEVYVMEGTR